MRTLTLMTLILAAGLTGCNRPITLCTVATTIENARDQVKADVEIAILYLREHDPDKALEIAEEAPRLMAAFQDIKFALVTIHDGNGLGTVQEVFANLATLAHTLDKLYLRFEGETLVNRDVKQLISLAAILAPDTRIREHREPCTAKYERTDYALWGRRLKRMAAGMDV